MRMRGCGAVCGELQGSQPEWVRRRTVWEGRPETVRARYPKRAHEGGNRPRVLRDTRNPVGIREDHLLRLNTPWRPIVNEYREGKVKSTAGAE